MVFDLSEPLSAEPILAHVREQEREYDWLGAAESYKRGLALVSRDDLSLIGELHERSGCALYRAALQAESVEAFRERIRQAIADHERAREFYGGQSEPGRTARTLRCDAMIAYLGYWVTSEVPEKKRLLDESWSLTKESLKKFEELGDAREYGTTYNQLLVSVIFRLYFESDFQAAEKIMREGLEHGEQAIRFLSTVGDPEELARAYVIAAGWLDGIAYSLLPDPDEQDKYRQKGLGYWKTAKELSEEAALLQLPANQFSWILGVGTDEALTINKKALEYCRKARDRLVVGLALESLAIQSFWKALGIEDPDEEKGLLKEAVRYAQEAKNQYSQILFTSPGTPVVWAEAPYGEYYLELARFETDLGKKRDLLEKSRDAALDHLERAQDSGYPSAISTGHHILSKALASLAKTEARTDAEKSLLERALEHRNESIKISEQFEPYGYWDLGVMQNYLANIKSELAELAKDPETKKNLLQDAILTKDACLKLCGRGMKWMERTGSVSTFAWIGEKSFEYGDLWSSLYDLTNDSENLRKAAEAFEHSAEYFEKPNLASRIAECYWKAAQAYGTLGEHLKAAEMYSLASNNYTVASEKIRQLEDSYRDHGSYMDAWSEIEKARYHHGREEYGLAKECYEKTTSLHKSTRQWSYLAPNYSAWARVENAEELSRREESQEAIQAFKEAARLFQEGKRTLQAEIARIENPDEKQMATKLARAADLRQEYCKARIVLEEAKLLDRKGDHYFSSEKYGLAAEAFEKTAQALESEQTRQEFKLIISLSKAWQMMTRAEAQASPGLYAEASRLFEEAKELSPNEKAGTLALGHSRFCRALELGTKFADTGDVALHAAAIQHLESAAKYYLKAGFQNASEYARASKLLFDAYVYMDEANREKDHEKKAKLYLMAEKVLQASADSFTKAEHPGKKEQVLRLPEKVKKERELAVSLTEVFHAPSFASTTATFSTPRPTFEKAVGLERFEHADIQASVITRQKSLNVGESLNLEIELVNAGRGPAQLIKVEEVIPEGFELMGKPEPYKVEDSYLNMKGKRLDPLKTEELRLVLRPKAQGQFTLKPRILYLDESGHYRSHEPEPTQVTVKELGITGWLKGR